MTSDAPSALLLDTHVILWAALDPGRLTARAMRVMGEAQRLHISALTSWEIGRLVKRRRIELDTPPRQWIQAVSLRFGLVSLPLTEDAALRAEELPEYPNADPIDRMIVGTALVYDLPLVTADETMRAWPGVVTLW